MPRATRTLPDQNYLRESLDYNIATGVLTWRKRSFSGFNSIGIAKSWNSRYSGKIAGTLTSNGYVIIPINNVPFLAHRIVWKLITGEEPPKNLDHINLTPTDNRFENLRRASENQNHANTKVRKTSRLGLKGVQAMNRCTKFAARISVNKKTIYLGAFDTPEEAHQAYCDAAKKYYGEFFNPG